jgi:hypothetical protein
MPLKNNNDPSLPIPQPTPTMERITDLDELVNNYKREHYTKPTKRAFLILLGLEVLLFCCLIFIGQLSAYWLVAIILLITPWLIEISHVTDLRFKLKHVFVQQFAQAQELSYQAQGQMQNINGEIFSKYNDKPYYLDIVSGSFNQIPFSIFTYQYTAHGRDGSVIIDQTVSRLEFSCPLPRLFLQSHKHGFEMINFCNGDNPQAHLDGDLDNTFTLWTLQGMQMEGLQIFTAEFTQPLADKWSDWHMEFINDYIYIYPYVMPPRPLEKWSDLERMLELIQYLATKLPERLKEMKSDIEAVESYKNI